MEKLTSFNYHQWKEDMENQLRSKKLFRLTMEIEVEPILNHEKLSTRIGLINPMDACVSQSLEIFFSTSRD